MSVIPSPWPVAHIRRYFDPDNEDDHGNHPRIEDPPVIRMVMSLVEAQATEDVTVSDALRTNTVIDMAVADPPTYAADDHVMLWPDLDENGDYVPGSGVLYWVDGQPRDERIGPWPELLAAFGGVVTLRKVT